MRLLQATVPPGALEDVKASLDERDADYFAAPETGTDTHAAVLYVPTPDKQVDGVLTDLYEAGLTGDDHVVILDTRADIFGRTGGPGRGGAANGAGEGGRAGGGKHERIVSAELKGKTVDLIPDFRTFLAMTVLATVVATTGLLLDSPAVVVASMVIAPILGPAISVSVGTVIDDPDLFRRGVRLQIIGVFLAVTVATLFAWVLKATYLTPPGITITSTEQIVARLSPDLLSLVVAFVAGTVGVLSLATGAGVTIVGVMMAAALLPPAATVGIGLAWGKPMVAVNSGVLLGVNLLAINLAGLATLWYLGYRPYSWVQIPQARRELLKRGGVLAVAILLASAFLVNATFANARRAQLENAIKKDVGNVLGQQRYANVSLVDVKVVQDRGTLTPRPDEVIVTIARPPGQRHLSLRQRIDQAVDRRAGQDLPTEVHVNLVSRVQVDEAALRRQAGGWLSSGRYKRSTASGTPAAQVARGGAAVAPVGVAEEAV